MVSVDRATGESGDDVGRSTKCRAIALDEARCGPDRSGDITGRPDRTPADVLSPRHTFAVQRTIVAPVDIYMVPMGRRHFLVDSVAQIPLIRETMSGICATESMRKCRRPIDR